MAGFYNTDATHSCCSPKYTSPFVSFDKDLIRKAKKIGLHADSPGFN
jgi:hypothetical protein